MDTVLTPAYQELYDFIQAHPGTDIPADLLARCSDEYAVRTGRNPMNRQLPMPNRAERRSMAKLARKLLGGKKRK